MQNLIFLGQVLPELLVNSHDCTATHLFLWYQLDGSFIHSNISVHNYLYATLGQRCIGRTSPVNQPVQLPNLSCMDYFFCAQVKSRWKRRGPYSTHRFSCRRNSRHFWNVCEGSNFHTAKMWEVYITCIVSNSNISLWVVFPFYYVCFYVYEQRIINTFFLLFWVLFFNVVLWLKKCEVRNEIPKNPRPFNAF